MKRSDRLLCCLIASAASAIGACMLADRAVAPGQRAVEIQSRFATTYEKLFPMAEAGDPDMQNLLGFMFFHGEGVSQDYDEAHIWFHRSADEGNINAQRNLGILHSGAVPGVPEHLRSPEEANRWLSLAVASDPSQTAEMRAASSRYEVLSPLPTNAILERGDRDIGDKVYRTFCAGCHGFDGFAAYPSAPSFALGERLEKSDSALVDSVFYGTEQKSAWGTTLSRELLRFAVASIRSRFEGSSGEDDARPQAAFVRFRNSDQRARGEALFMMFCAGCHGFNGIAYYVHSPSFAIGERLTKSDLELEQSILRGIGPMPGWEAMLTH
ncbi:MAG: c-type cytochrome, partial [Deltaproteobacteria bacterium]|nr:c-type cytochrome [Deltaproteobacteria bacterium]